jgi:hypothetical protein
LGEEGDELVWWCCGMYDGEMDWVKNRCWDWFL